MPELTRVLTKEDLARRGATQRQDLSTYMSLIDQIREGNGVGGVITLREDEQQRTEKRRLSIAAKQRGYALTWRRAADPRQLRFVLAEEGQPTPGGRKRRTIAEQQMEALAGEGAMTEQTEALVETPANAEAVPEPAPQARNGRRRRKE